MLLLPVFLYSQNAKKYYKAGEVFLASENYPDAVDQFTKAIDLKPAFDKAYLARARAYEQLDLLEEAVQDYDRASTFLNKEHGIFYEAGRLYYQLGRYEQALNRLDKSIRVKKNYEPAYVIKSKVLISQERYEEALENCNIALSLKKTADNYYQRGLVNERLGQFEAAERDFVQAISENKSFVDAYLSLAQISLNLGKTQFALGHVNKALELEPQNRKAFLIRSRIYAKQLDYPKAIDDISVTIMMDPEDDEMYLLRGTYYQEFTQHTNAINDFTKAIILNENNADAYYKRAELYEQIAHYSSAIKDYETLVAMSEYDVRAQELLENVRERLFALNYESNKPEIILIDPEPGDDMIIRLPRGSVSVSLRGRILDESDLKFLKINGVNMAYTMNDEQATFNLLVHLESQDPLIIEVADVYDNIQTVEYTIQLTEIDPPAVKVIVPYASGNNEIYLDQDTPEIYIEGKIEDESLIKSIWIDSTVASYIPEEINPSFYANLNIRNKTNIVVRVVDLYGNEVIEEYRINRESAILSKSNPMGKTWIVFIENSDYKYFTSLAGPSRDVVQMKTALAKYQIHNIIHMKNMEKKDMEKFFSIDLRDLVIGNHVNSLMIWYAGHGIFMNETGYWVPVDARKGDEFSLFNVNALKASLQSYSKYVTHTLVVTDACESGPGFCQTVRSELKEKSCDDWQATRSKSAQVFSSAGYEKAADYSQFTRTFANLLTNSPESCLPIEKIVSRVIHAVTANNQQEPKFGRISGLEDEGGTFFFISDE